MPDLELEEKEIRPQKGFQEDFCSSIADITVGGGMAGVGKSWCLQIAPLRHQEVRNFNCITFRRTMEQIKNPGSLWDKSAELYPMFGFRANEQAKTWMKKDLGITLKYSHLQYEKDIYSHDGSEYCLICFDELQSFDKKQFFYLLSRNRSTCGVRPYVLASCNPDPDSFLADFLEWWIDQDEILLEDKIIEGVIYKSGTRNPNWGYAIPERIGKIRYMIVFEDDIIWGDSKEEIILNHPDIFFNLKGNPEDLIKSVTFITGSIYDNKKLLETNPGYLANLMALDEVEKIRLLYGNWKISVTDKSLYKYEALVNAFTNTYPSFDRTGYITCDAARFGDDLATIFTWIGWIVVRLDIFTKSSKYDIIKQVEKNRVEFGVTKSNTLIDQDGLGGHIVKDGKYKGFSGGDPALPVYELKDGKQNPKKEYYFNLKAQLAYRYAERFNSNQVTFQLDEGSIYVDGYHGTKIKLKNKTYDVRDLIKLDYRAIKQKDVDSEGKKKINDKADQKRILKGRSPDFYDGSFIRELFEIKRTGTVIGLPMPPNMKIVHGDSILDMLG